MSDRAACTSVGPPFVLAQANGRAAIFTGDPNGVYFAVGNDNNGNQPTVGPPYNAVLTALIKDNGVQVITRGIPSRAAASALAARLF